MELHPTGTGATSNALLVCRNVRWNVLVLLAIFWGAAALWWYVGAPKWVVIGCGLTALLLTLPMINTWRRRGRADNWVLAIYGDGLWLNLRDCEYLDAEPGNSVVFLPYREISQARRFIHRYTTPSNENADDISYTDVYLELLLAGCDTAALKKALADERRIDPPERAYLGGYVKIGSSRSHFPIALEGDSAIRIKFTVFTSGYGLKPQIKKVLAVLGRYITVGADFEQNLENWRKLSENEFDNLVRRLVDNGHDLDASRLLRERNGVSATEAHNFVEGLKRVNSPATSG